MDILFFLKRRTEFIRYFYDASSKTFHETKQKIEDEEPPFDSPPYDESGEPAYMEEWTQAENALNVLGRNCVSMLSASLKLYFMTWESELGMKCKSAYQAVFNKKGALNGYRACFEDEFRVPWKECPANLDVIEQVFLIRNKDQHPNRISTFDVSYIDSKKKQKRPDSLFFIGEAEKAIIDDTEMESLFPLFSPVRISREKLFEAIGQVERFAEWFEGKILLAQRDGK